MRMTGSAGGHNGVHSLIDSLGTRDFRRVKIGIGRPGASGEKRAQVSDHVLSPFDPEEHEAIEAACAEAADRALELVERATRVSPHCACGHAAANGGSASIARGGGAWYTLTACSTGQDAMRDVGVPSELRKRRHHGKPSAERTCKALATFKKAQKRQRMSE